MLKEVQHVLPERNKMKKKSNEDKKIIEIACLLLWYTFPILFSLLSGSNREVPGISLYHYISSQAGKIEKSIYTTKRAE